MGWAKLTDSDHPEYDIAVQIISIKPERREKVDFSEPFLLANQALLVRRDTPIAHVASLEQLRPYLLGGMPGGTGTQCSQLRERVNSALGDMRTDGTWRRIVDRWFPEMDELPRLG